MNASDKKLNLKKVEHRYPRRNPKFCREKVNVAGTELGKVDAVNAAIPLPRRRQRR